MTDNDLKTLVYFQDVGLEAAKLADSFDLSYLADGLAALRQFRLNALNDLANAHQRALQTIIENNQLVIQGFWVRQELWTKQASLYQSLNLRINLIGLELVTPPMFSMMDGLISILSELAGAWMRSLPKISGLSGLSGLGTQMNFGLAVSFTIPPTQNYSWPDQSTGMEDRREYGTEAVEVVTKEEFEEKTVLLSLSLQVQTQVQECLEEGQAVEFRPNLNVKSKPSLVVDMSTGQLLTRQEIKALKYKIKPEFTLRESKLVFGKYEIQIPRGGPVYHCLSVMLSAGADLRKVWKYEELATRTKGWVDEEQIGTPELNKKIQTGFDYLKRHKLPTEIKDFFEFGNRWIKINPKYL